MPPLLSVSDLAAPPPPDPTKLVPPPRFANASFASYEPQHLSQSQARARLQEFIEARHSTSEPPPDGRPSLRRPWGRLARLGRADGSGRVGAGIYLDGGFGVGKTHLLAAAYAEADSAAKRYLTFQELVYLIGIMGRVEAERTLARTQLLCIDEFELDDPGNTLIVKSFLAALFEAGGTVVTTSNTPPEAQGEGRFNAEDFKREIQSVAARFEVLTVGGPDFRSRLTHGDWLSSEDMELLLAQGAGPTPRLRLTYDELTTLLAGVHPSRYGGLLAQVGTVFLHGARTIPNQNEALRFVHFVDKLYDGAVALRATGEVPLAELFDPAYRDSAYQKKHYRCLSRLGELLAEAESALPSAGSVAQAVKPGA